MRQRQVALKATTGKYWTISSTEKQFGKVDPNDILSDSGPPGWKQRAFYD